MRSFLDGFRTPLRGFGILRSNPGLWPWALGPFLVALLIVGITVFLGWHYLDSITAALLESRGFFEGLVNWKDSLVARESFWAFFPKILLASLRFLFQIIAMLGAAVLGYLLSMILSGTLWEFHVEGTAKKLNFALQVESDRHWTIRYSQSLGREVIKSVVLILIPTFIFVLGWIPVLGWIFSVILLPVVTAFLLGFSIVDYAMSVEERPLSRRLRWSRENFFFLLGAGIVLSIPIVNVFILPFSITGVTERYAHSWKSKQME